MGSRAFADIGYRIEDGDIGYVGNTHGSFAARPAPRVAHIRATARGDEALASIKTILTGKAANGAGQSTTPRRVSVTPDAYWSAISRVVRGRA